MKHWGECISYDRFGYQGSSSQGSRSEFTRDYDRIIFLSAFRRLQNKTQVFPLPGNVFVHNRLTHSLEVASVGRSLGSMAGQAICDHYGSQLTDAQRNFFHYELSGVVASACLAHDVGNPAFGHSGEKAISNFFVSHQQKTLNGSTLKSHFSPEEWNDLIHFEGNANALRLLTRQFKGKLEGGQRLMQITLASILKYPCHSSEMDKSTVHKKKYGYFQSDRAAFEQIVTATNMREAEGTVIRHPFVYLVEAADDICYRIIDMEDAHRIGILPQEVTEHAFLALLSEIGDNLTRTKEILTRLTDPNEAISFLRAKCINGLVGLSAETFHHHAEAILTGAFNSTLLDEIERKCPYLQKMNDISVKKIYNHPSVVEVELAGYNVMSEVLAVFIDAMLSTDRSSLQKKFLQLIPEQYMPAEKHASAYEKTMCVLDYVSGMTDGFATELYRKLKGIDIPTHK